MTIISFIAINFGAIYRTTKSSYRDSPINDNILGWSNPLRSNVKTAHPVFGLFRCLWSMLYSYLNQTTPERTTFSAVLVRLFGAHHGSCGSIHTYSNKSLFESNQTCQMRTHPKSSLNLVVILHLVCLQVAFLNVCTHSTCRDGVCCIYCELSSPETLKTPDCNLLCSDETVSPPCTHSSHLT